MTSRGPRISGGRLRSLWGQGAPGGSREPVGGPRGPRKIPRGSDMVKGDVYKHGVPGSQGGCQRVPRESREICLKSLIKQVKYF